MLSLLSRFACPKLSCTLHPSSQTDTRPQNITLRIGLNLMYAIHFEALSPPTEDVLFLTREQDQTAA